MKKLDRFLLFFVGLGVWAFVAVLLIKPSWLSAGKVVGESQVAPDHQHHIKDIKELSPWLDHIFEHTHAENAVHSYSEIGGFHRGIKSYVQKHCRAKPDGEIFCKYNGHQ